MHIWARSVQNGAKTCTNDATLEPKGSNRHKNRAKRQPNCIEKSMPDKRSVLGRPTSSGAIHIWNLFGWKRSPWGSIFDAILDNCSIINPIKTRRRNPDWKKHESSWTIYAKKDRNIDAFAVRKELAAYAKPIVFLKREWDFTKIIISQKLFLSLQAPCKNMLEASTLEASSNHRKTTLKWSQNPFKIN